MVRRRHDYKKKHFNDFVDVADYLPAREVHQQGQDDRQRRQALAASSWVSSPTCVPTCSARCGSLTWRSSTSINTEYALHSPHTAQEW